MQPSDHQLILSFVMLLIISALTAYYAEQKGRSSITWFILALLLSFIAPIILYFLPSLREEEEKSTQPTYPIPVSPVTPPPTPEDIDMISDKLWYYLDANHQQYGPVSLIALKELWNTASLDLRSYVWSEGMEKWERVEDLPKLREALHHPIGLV